MVDSAPVSHHHKDDPARSFIAVIRTIADSAPDEGTNVGGIVDQMDERAFALLILVFAIPCLVPALPGAQVIAIPIFLLGLQLMIGRSEPWLPGWVMRLSVKKSWLEGIAAFCEKHLRWTERLARPRARVLATGLFERFAGLITALAAVTIMLPITNTIPSLAITVLAVGLLQRDGLFVGAGTLLAAGWVAGLSTLVVGLIYGAGFIVSFAQEHVPFLANLLGR